MEKCVNEAMSWMNIKMLAQSKLSIAQDPAVKVVEIIQKIQVSKTVLDVKQLHHSEPSIVIDTEFCMSSLSAGNRGALQSCGEPTQTKC